MLGLAISIAFASAALLAVATIVLTLGTHGAAVRALFAEARAEKARGAFTMEPREAAGDVAATLLPVTRYRPVDASQICGRLVTARPARLPLRAVPLLAAA